MKVASLEFHSFKIRLFYLLQDKALVVATRPDVLARVLEGKAPAQAGEPCNVALTLYPEQWKAIRPDMLLGYEEGARKICARNLMELQPFADANLEEAERILGMALECPDGCSYAKDDEGNLHCALHGSSAFPRQGAVPAEANPVNQLLMDLGEIRFSMGYTEHGIHTRITVKR